MNYIQKAKDYASMVAYSTSGDEYTFDETDLEYFLDSIGFDTINNKIIKTIADEELLQQALDALEKISMGGSPEWADDVIPSLRARLAQDKENNGH
jgi:hypothetical protein